MNYMEFASAVDAQYSLFQFALSGIYLGMTGTNLDVSSQALREYRTRARNSSGAFLDTVNRTIGDFGNGVEEFALNSRKPYFMGQVRRIVAENIKTVEQRLMGGKMTLASVLSNAAHGGIGLLLQRRASSIDFKSTDAAGRKWKSSDLLHSYARDFAYQVVIDTQVAQLKAEGSVLGKVVYPDPHHRYQHTILSLGAMIDGHATLNEMRDVIFHPNATAELLHV